MIRILSLRSKWQVFVTCIGDLECDLLLHFGSLLRGLVRVFALLVIRFNHFFYF